MKGLGIKEVHYHDPNTRDYIERVKAMHFRGVRNCKPTDELREYTREEILEEIQMRDDVYTVLEDNHLGHRVNAIHIGEEDFIRTDRKKIGHDEVDEVKFY